MPTYYDTNGKPMSIPQEVLIQEVPIIGLMCDLCGQPVSFAGLDATGALAQWFCKSCAVAYAGYGVFPSEEQSTG